jgi:hypothetical protein
MLLTHKLSVTTTLLLACFGLTGVAKVANGSPNCSEAQISAYVTAIKEAVERRWQMPRDSVGPGDDSCILYMRQTETGRIASHELRDCKGSEVFENSVSEALSRIEHLPLPDNRACYDPEIVIRFTLPRENIQTDYRSLSETERTAESLDLFGVFPGQDERTAIGILESKSPPQMAKRPCASEWIAKMDPPLDMGTTSGGSCLASAQSETEPNVGELKIYTVEFAEQYETSPGQGVVSLVNYGHFWDPYRISQTFDPFALSSKRFGPPTEEYDDFAFWDFYVNGDRVRVVLRFDNFGYLDVGNKLGFLYEGYELKIIGKTSRDNLRDMRKFIMNEQAKLKESGSDPDF